MNMTKSVGIIVKKENKDKINAAILSAEGRATVRCITYESVVNECAKIEARLGIGKAAMNGVVYEVDYHAQHFARAYKYTPMSTQFTLTYKNGTWRISNIRRERTRNSGNTEFIGRLTPVAEEAVLKKLRMF